MLQSLAASTSTRGTATAPNFERLQSVGGAGCAEALSYDADGIETTHYAGGLLEKVASTVSGLNYWRHYVPTPGGTTVEVSRNSNGTSSTDYLLTDHLGSTDAVLDGTGGFVLQASFDTFGKRRGSDWSAATPPEWTAIAQTTRVGYTGQEMVDNVGLVHLNGRVYDPAIGRFLSVDPLIGELADSQSVNPYAYVGNRPLSYTDPSGDVAEYIAACLASGPCRSVVVSVVETAWNFVSPGGGHQPPPATVLPGQSAQRGTGLCGPGNTSPACGGMVVYASAPTTESGVPSSTWAANPDQPDAMPPSYPGELGAQAAVAGLIFARNPNIPTAVKLGGPVLLAVGTGAVLLCGSSTPLCALIVSAADLGSQPIGDVPYAGAAGRTAGTAARGAVQSAASAVRLEKQLASQAQMVEVGQVMAGAGSRTVFRDAQRIARQYGGNAADWVKKTSSSYVSRDGTRFETHWAENVKTGQRVEFKTKFPGDD